MKRTRNIIALVLAVLMLFSLVGCGNNTANKNSDGPRTDVIIGIGAEGTSMDPHKCMNGDISYNMIEGLTKLNENNEIVPCIAKSWEISPDELEYTFTIDTDRKFANGDNVTAQDVVYSLKRADEEPTNQAIIFDTIESIELVDETTVKITLMEPSALLLAGLSEFKCGIVSERAVTEAGSEYDMNPAGSGTGPYDFVSWESGVCVKMTANPHYNAELAIKDVEFRFITEANTGVISVEAGDIDLFLNPSYTDVVNLQNSEKVTVHKQQSYSVDFLGFNTMKEPFNIPEVRRAVAYGINHEELITAAIGEGGATVANGFLPNFVFGYSDELEKFERDPEMAKKLLADAGYPNGIELTITTTDGSRSKIVEYLQEALKDCNITVNVEMTEWSKFVQDLMEGNVSSFIVGAGNSFPDAEFFLGQIFVSGGLGNVSAYSNPEVDELLIAARMTNDTETRLANYKAAQEILMDEVPVIPLYFNDNYAIANPALQGFGMNLESNVRVWNLNWGE